MCNIFENDTNEECDRHDDKIWCNTSDYHDKMNLTDCGPQGSGDCSMAEMADNTQRGESQLTQVSAVMNSI